MTKSELPQNRVAGDQLRPSMPYVRSRDLGFTLIELMIVVVIIGIIAAFAYPSYQDSVRKSRRSDARGYLMELAARQEQYFNDNKSYTIDPAKLGKTGTSPQGYYKIKITDRDPDDGDDDNTIGTDYLITAEADGIQADDTACATLTLSSAGIKSSTPAGGSCW